MHVIKLNISQFIKKKKDRTMEVPKRNRSHMSGI